MFAAAKAANATMTWIPRIVGFFMMAIGICMVVSPIVVFADVIPFLGDLLGMGAMLFAGLVGFALSLGTISIAWVVFRPMVGVPLLAVGLGSVVVAKRMCAKKKADGFEGTDRDREAAVGDGEASKGDCEAAHVEKNEVEKDEVAPVG